MSEIVTRFAPSPTGYLHIGGARTALFNWLYSRGRGGKFLLRIEDTDRARSTDEAIAAIFDGLNWLGLDWDGEPVHQFARAERHREVAEQLLAADKAYYCYASQEELEALREVAARSGRSIAEIIRDAIRQVVLKPQVTGPVAIWDGKPKRTSIDHDSVHDEP